MDRWVQVIKLHRELTSHRHPVSAERLIHKLEISSATFKRLLQYMRDTLQAPIVYSRKANGYHYDTSDPHNFHLPGLWFSAVELLALTTLKQLLQQSQPGLLEQELAPLQQVIDKLLEKTGEQQGIGKRVRLVPINRRRVDDDIFRRCVAATAECKCLDIHFYNKSRDDLTERRVSPQRLVYYRDNWYLDAWCHLRNGLRNFSLDGIRQASLTDGEYRAFDDSTLKNHFASSYGIFAGEPEHRAVLRFTPARARYVANEHWHTQQKGEYLADGRYQLTIPYSDPRELLMDILKHGPEVELISPPELKDQLRQMLMATLGQYQKSNNDQPNSITV